MPFRQRWKFFLVAHTRWWVTPLIVAAVAALLLLWSSKNGKIPWIYALF